MVTIDLNLWLSSGVFAIRRKVDGRMFISGSLCMLDSLVRHIKQISLGHSSVRELNVGLDGLEPIILETNINKKKLKLRTQFHIDLHRDKVLNKKDTFKCTISMEIVHNRVHVHLKTKNRSKILVGVFRKMKEANSFVQEHYKDEVKDIVYCNNLLTRAWRRGEKDA